LVVQRRDSTSVPRETANRRRNLTWMGCYAHEHERHELRHKDLILSRLRVDRGAPAVNEQSKRASCKMIIGWQVESEAMALRSQNQTLHFEAGCA
jgi:hypothetical protein